jgi:translocation and assembly module TamB
MALGQPFDSASARISLTPGLISLDALKADMAGGKIALDGKLQHPSDRFTAGHADLHLQTTGVNLAQVAALQLENAGIQGAVTLTAGVTADVHDKQDQNRFEVSNVTADFSATGLRIRNQDAGSLSATARTSSGDVTYSAHSNFAGSTITFDGHTKLVSAYPTTARAVIRNLPTANALELIGQSQVPVDGLLTADATVTGDLRSSDATLGLELTKASIYQETVNRLTAKIQYKNGALDVPQFDVLMPAGSVNLSGRYVNTGALQLRVNSSDLDTAKSKRIQQLEPGISGKLRVNADLAAKVSTTGSRTDMQLSSLNAQLSANGLYLEKRKIGDLNFSARTNQSNVTFQLNSDLAQSEIHVSGSTQLVKDYPTQAEATFKNVRYENLAPILQEYAGMPAPVHGLVEGKASLNGPILNTDLLAANVQLSRLEITSSQRRSTLAKPVNLQNDRPIVVTFAKNLLTVQRFSMRGTDTSLDVTGSVDTANAENVLHLNLKGNLDLGILQQTDRDFYSSGTVALKTNVAGTLTHPFLNGQIALQNANINYANAPNGISNANGIIQLSGNTAVVQNLTAESGGGKVQVSGSVGLGLGTAIYNLRAKATRVRTRYDNASITSNANISLNGNSRLSLLSGRITVERIAYSSSSDIGSLLSNASSPPSTPSEPSPMLSGMRLDVQITTASDLRVSSTYVEKLEVNSNLTVCGTAAEPGILGHLNITDGQLVFFGNTYSVNTGSINFYDASSIRPELNLSLETVAQGVDVTLGVKGPVSNMKLSYRSDPPLTFEQIVQLLATNTTPFDPTIAAHQPPAAQQSLSQMGESQVLGQAVANPVASRLQRVFGLSQFKIDPSIAGNNGQPTAKVTLSQKITKDITFTYITDVTQTNSEIVRVQWDLSSKTSAVALRDYNGNVSVQLFHKFQVR